jgi:hypothetical protein
VVDVEQWAEVRRMKRVEGLSAREISRRTGLGRDTVSRLLMAETPPRYSRARAESILDPFKDWICEQLQGDPKVPSRRLRELAVRWAMRVARRSLTHMCGRSGLGFW